MKHTIILLLIGITIPTLIYAHENHHNDFDILFGTRNYDRKQQGRINKKEIRNEKKERNKSIIKQ